MSSEESAYTEQQRLIVERRLERERKADQLSKAVLAEEDARRATDAKKTARLKTLREAKEAADDAALVSGMKRVAKRQRGSQLQNPRKEEQGRQAGMKSAAGGGGEGVIEVERRSISRKRSSG
jgi:hypothetical protein